MHKLRLANFLSRNYHPASAALAARLSTALGTAVAFQPEADFGQLRDGQLQLANLCGLALVTFEDSHPGLLEPLVAPLIDDPRTAERPVYFCDLVIRRDLPAARLEDLRGLRFAYNEAVSFSGYLAARHGLAQCGLDWSLFGRMLHSGSHQQSLQMLAEGRADVAALDSHSLRVELSLRPVLRDRLCRLTHFGPFPMPPLAVSRALSASLKRALREALITLPINRDEQPALAAAAVTGFAAVAPEDYEPIRRIAREHAPELVANDFCTG